jgi:6-phosphogluconolactonase
MLSTQMHAPSQSFLVGAYSSGTEKGAVRLALDHDRNLVRGARIVGLENASYGARADAGLHYFLDERERGKVSAWRRQVDGAWQLVSSVASGSSAPCYLAMDSTGRMLAIAHYATGVLAFHRIDAAGQFAGAPLTVSNHGSGPDRSRQTGPHGHCVKFVDRYIYATDLGTDEVLCLPYDAGQVLAADRFVACKLPGGEGPRHIVFNATQSVAYVLTEMGNKIFALHRQSDGRLACFQQISTLPDSFQGKSAGGHIAIGHDGRVLYVSNRGHDSIASFAVGGDGDLKLLRLAPSGGASPRHFVIADQGRALIVANEQGNNVAGLDIDADQTVGGVRSTVAITKPAFIALGA